MNITIEDGILLAIQIPCYIFHASMAFFIGWNIFKKVAFFNSAFFFLYFLLSIADLTYFWVVSVISLKIPQFGFFTNFYINASGLATFGFFTSVFCGVFQSLTHLTMALNRFNIFYFPQSFNKNWNNRNFRIILFLQFIIAFLCISWFLNQTVYYSYTPPSSIIMTFVDKSVQIAISIMLVTLYSISCTIQTIVGIATAIRYNNLNKIGKISSDQRAAVILFLYSMCLTAGQILRATYHGTVIAAMLTSNLVLSSFMQKRLPIIVDVSVLSGSIFLFLLSKKVRKSYIKFYSSSKGHSSSVTSTTIILHQIR